MSQRTFCGSVRKEIVGITQHHSSLGHTNSLYFPLESCSSSTPLSQQEKGIEEDNSLFSSQKQRIKRFFLPNQYPQSVNSDYWSVQKHWNVQWATSSALQVFATQSLLTSVGIGSDVAVPLAATANWVLKDVLACVGVMVVANRVGNYFDVHLKRSKWLSDILLNAGVMIELMVQWFPSKFIILASISTLLKAISGMVNGTAKANINRHFSSAVKGKNLGDVTAKGQSQGVFSYVIGLFYGVGASYISHSTETPYFFLANVAILTSIHMYNGYLSLINLNLKVLNDRRGEIVTQNYLQELLKTGFQIPEETVSIPSPTDVAKEENFIWKEENDYSLVMGSPIDKLLENSDLQTVLNNTSVGDIHEKYLINDKGKDIIVSLSSKSSEKDNFLAFFHSQVFMFHKRNQCNSKDAWSKSKSIVKNCFPHYLETLQANGWETKYILLFITKDTPKFSYAYKDSNL